MVLCFLSSGAELGVRGKSWERLGITIACLAEEEDLGPEPRRRAPHGARHCCLTRGDGSFGVGGVKFQRFGNPQPVILLGIVDIPPKR